MSLTNPNPMLDPEENVADRRAVGQAAPRSWTLNRPRPTTVKGPPVSVDVNLVGDRPGLIGPEYRPIFMGPGPDAVLTDILLRNLSQKVLIIDALMPSLGAGSSQAVHTAERAFVPFGTIGALVFATACLVAGITLGLTHAIGPLQGLALLVAGLGLGSSSVAYLVTMERAGRRAGPRARA